MDASVPIPPPQPDDDEDVNWALSTAGALWGRGEHAEALKWLRRAAEQASDANADARALELFKAAADVATKVKNDAATPAPPPAAVPSVPPPSAAAPPPSAAAAAPPPPKPQPSVPPPKPSVPPPLRKPQPSIPPSAAQGAPPLPSAGAPRPQPSVPPAAPPHPPPRKSPPSLPPRPMSASAPSVAPPAPNVAPPAPPRSVPPAPPRQQTPTPPQAASRPAPPRAAAAEPRPQPAKSAPASPKAAPASPKAAPAAPKAAPAAPQASAKSAAPEKGQGTQGRSGSGRARRKKTLEGDEVTAQRVMQAAAPPADEPQGEAAIQMPADDLDEETHVLDGKPTRSVTAQRLGTVELVDEAFQSLLAGLGGQQAAPPAPPALTEQAGTDELTEEPTVSAGSGSEAIAAMAQVAAFRADHAPASADGGAPAAALPDVPLPAPVPALEPAPPESHAPATEPATALRFASIPALRVAVLGSNGPGEPRVLILDANSPPPEGAAVAMLVPVSAADAEAIAQLLGAWG